MALRMSSTAATRAGRRATAVGSPHLSDAPAFGSHRRLRQSDSARVGSRPADAPRCVGTAAARAHDSTLPRDEQRRYHDPDRRRGARGVAGVANATTLEQSILSHHTTAEDAGRLAQMAGVKTLVLSHLIPAEDPAVTDQMWTDAARTHFRGTVIVARDLLEV